jgi:hypothetical protein
MTTWVGSNEVALLPGSYCTTLKALTGATAEELQFVIECLKYSGSFVTARPGAGKKRKRAARRRSK